jgi:hypothetical protein
MSGQSFENKSLCNIPNRLRPIADAYRRMARRNVCQQLPCDLVHRSLKTDKRIITLANGQLVNISSSNGPANGTLARTVECITSPALDLFSHGAPYPSLTTNGYTPVVRDLFADTLSRNYRSSESIWGLSLNWESIRNYPWSGDKTMVALFDITEGYDRRLYDIIADSYFSYDAD